MTALMHSIWTVVVFIVFIGIIVWAYSGRRKKDFDEAARLVLDEDDPVQVNQEKEKAETESKDTQEKS
ncbi:MAG: cbb3-type cytochrome oxidase subunit 3 [Gammaproteobacteria bacterium]|jgi:cytochrome c oxidase cbb3-type subunit 4|nr:cbb3-type cytochrome oxidase subunit 3 [Gammaproteobacteria bacterium]MBT3723809.1 cbb3-type cytochrome oxidase subunit 3 [Gammaproteobacteria bacterium]MBT4078899.1 cbb3-type cytochrome oxidase subunit 3 [Gammaproteobacteria bacterium]MBT4196397.1 cbb3-type cytochrome oxidase subunit 3 [Gammaproteobacteria bacterium]MBT4448182.1 cbb3-type cytochrome oxidase subunit 3 [Gammaproteobacteria bacterium]